MEIAGRTFVITGGASGLGAACARQLAKRGAHVVIADLNEAAGELLADELGAAGSFVRLDVTQAADVERALATAAAGPGGLRGVVQCAGVIAAGRILGRQGPHELELFEKVVRVNLVGTFNVLRLAATVMSTTMPEADGERGVIINTSSIAAYEGQIGQAAYAASKGGVAALTLPAARELARFGIRVMAIAPGIFETPMMGQVLPEARDSLVRQVPFPNRFGNPDEFAALVEHIIENRMLNGSVIRLDGGARMEPK